jgi:hypothetical protein
MNLETLARALSIIGATPGYKTVHTDLTRLISKNKLRFSPRLPDRAQTSLFGIITLGPEAVESSPLSLAQTLVHEQFHLHQNPLLKTVSFWVGVFTRTPVMQRYEQPAYQAAIDFLEAVKSSHSVLKHEANREQSEVRQAFHAGYGGILR